MEDRPHPTPAGSGPSSPGQPTPDLRPAGARARWDTVEVGDVIGGYTLKDEIGAGGMGRVFLAHDGRLDRFVALKVLMPGASDEESRARFLREARALARVDHENVVRVNASGVDGDVAWMALEYIEGDALDDVLAGGPLDEESALLLAAQAARGLAAIHRMGVIHRDVKPANLLLDDVGVLRVVDLGVAYFTERGPGGFVTQAGVAVGTPHFMSPEQARGGEVDARADAWGLGATLFMMVSGAPPFFHEDDEADLDILARVLREPAPSLSDRAPGTSAQTAEVVRRLLVPQVAERPADLDEVATLLEACADHLAGRGPAPFPLDEEEPAAAVDDPEPAPAEAGPVEESPAAPTERAHPVVQLGLLGMLALLVVGAGLVGAQLFQERTPVPAEPSGASAGGLVAEDPRPRGPDEGPLVLPGAPERPVSVEPPVEPPVEDPERVQARALEAAVLDGGEGAEVGLQKLVALDTEASRASVLRLVSSSPRASDVVEEIARQGARQHLQTLTHAVLHADTRSALVAVSALGEIKTGESLELLQAAEASHPDARVRAAAAKARRGIFSVEGEE